MYPIPWRILPLLGLSCLCFCTISPVDAAEWTDGASVDTGIVYTDNVCLSDKNKQDQWIGTVTPSGYISADGTRANLDLNGSVEVNTLSNSKLKQQGCSGGNFGNREQFAPRLNGRADAILVDNWFYIDATADISQNEVTPFASGGGDSLDRTGNTNTTYNYSVSPYLSRRFKDFARLFLRYTWDEQYNSTDAVRDSSEESVVATFGSIPGHAKYSWGVQGNSSVVSYSNSRNQFEDTQDSKLRSAQINQGFQFNRAWQINGYYGREWNDFVSSRDDIDGYFWDVGFRWTPNPRIKVEAGVGHRFFGNDPRFSMDYRHKRSAFRASYRKSLTYDRNIRTLPDAPPLDPELPPPPDLNPGVTTITSSPILDERYEVAYTFKGRRTRFGVSAFQSQQSQESPNSFTGIRDSEYRGASVSVRRSLPNNTSLTFGADWNQQDPRHTNSEVQNQFYDNSETWSGSVRLSHRLGQRTVLGLTYRYTDRSSDRDFNNYTENRIMLDVKIDLLR